jgi:hypothetical protein
MTANFVVLRSSAAALGSLRVDPSQRESLRVDPSQTQDDTRVSPQTEDHSAEKEGAFRGLPVVANRKYLYMGPFRKDL